MDQKKTPLKRKPAGGKNRDSTYATWIRSLKREHNEFRRKTLFLGRLFDDLSKASITAYLVGGQAVEVYTGGQFATGDVDITTSNSEKTGQILRKIGFIKTGMIWLHENLGIAVQIVADYPSRTEKARTIRIEGNKVMIVGLEDLIVDRLVAAKFWRNNPKLDIEQATVLLNEFRDSLDYEYLNERASQEKVDNYFRSLPKNLGRS